MKLSKWAKKQGISYTTAFRWFKQGKMPCPTTQTASGTIIVHDDQPTTQPVSVAVYCRVSSHDKKDDLARQVTRCLDYCAAKGYAATIYKEIGSGMNDNRSKLLKMLDSNPTIIVVENKDRLTRFGFNYLNVLLNKLNCTIEVINTEMNDEADLIKDMISIITSFCCRLYGMRRGYNKAKAIKDSIENVSI